MENETNSFSLCLQITPDEIRNLIAKYNNTDQLAQSGVTVAGTKYMYLSSTDKVIRAKKGTSGVHAIKTNQSKCCSWNYIRRTSTIDVTFAIGILHNSYPVKTIHYVFLTWIRPQRNFKFFLKTLRFLSSSSYNIHFLIPSHSNGDHISTGGLSSLTPETKAENLDFTKRKKGSLISHFKNHA